MADYIGRSLCEVAVSDWACTLTLTYAPRDDLADKVLQPRHFQNFIKSLRYRGHKIRYLVAGEYGELKGRAHFHAVLFGKGQAPQWPQRERCWPDEWGEGDRNNRRSFGHVYVDWSVDHRALAYVIKYLLKWDETPDTWVSMSKKPPLGAEWFAAKAARDVESGVLPSSFEYHPPGGRRQVPYMMTGATRRDYLAAVVAGFARTRSIDPHRLSEWVYKSVEAHEWRVALADEDRRWKAAGLDAFIAEMLDRLESVRLTEEQVARSIQRDAMEWPAAYYIEGAEHGQKKQRQTKAEDERALFDTARRVHLSSERSEERRQPRSWPYSPPTPYKPEGAGCPRPATSARPSDSGPRDRSEASEAQGCPRPASAAKPRTADAVQEPPEGR